METLFRDFVEYAEDVLKPEPFSPLTKKDKLLVVN